jgi:hypothetical protein
MTNPDIQYFGSDGIWRKPPGAVRVELSTGHVTSLAEDYERGVKIVADDIRREFGQPAGGGGSDRQAQECNTSPDAGNYYEGGGGAGGNGGSFCQPGQPGRRGTGPGGGAGGAGGGLSVYHPHTVEDRARRNLLPGDWRSTPPTEGEDVHAVWIGGEIPDEMQVQVGQGGFASIITHLEGGEPQ